VSIVGEEVFSFKMTLYPGATKGDGYTDTSKVDGKVILRLGCIQIVYLHKFLMSLLVRINANALPFHIWAQILLSLSSKVNTNIVTYY